MAISGNLWWHFYQRHHLFPCHDRSFVLITTTQNQDLLNFWIRAPLSLYCLWLKTRHSITDSCTVCLPLLGNTCTLENVCSHRLHLKIFARTGCTWKCSLDRLHLKMFARTGCTWKYLLAQVVAQVAQLGQVARKENSVLVMDVGGSQASLAMPLGLFKLPVSEDASYCIHIGWIYLTLPQCVCLKRKQWSAHWWAWVDGKLH